VPGLQAFLVEAPKAPLFGIGIRNDLTEESKATQQAWRTLSGSSMVTPCFWTQPLRESGSYFVLQPLDAPNAGLRVYTSEGTWFSVVPKNPESQRGG